MKRLSSLFTLCAMKMPAAFSQVNRAWAAARAQISRLTRRQIVTTGLMATTALTALQLQPPAKAPEPVWGHSAVNAAAGGVSAEHSLQMSTESCFYAQRVENRNFFREKPGEWRGFYAIATDGGDFSHGLHRLAREHAIAICPTTDANAVRNYDSASRSAGIAANTALDANIREAVHGLMHGLMVQRNLSQPAADEALFSRLNRRLTAEAVAVTAEFVVAEEMHRRGENGPLQDLLRARTPGVDYFRHALDVEHKRNPQATPRQHIERAASHTVNYLLRQPEFIRANSDDVLRGYLNEIGLDGGKRVKASSAFTATDAKKMGEMGDHSISAHVRPLSAQELASIAPATAQVTEALQGMHARKVNDRQQPALAKGHRYAGIKYAQVSEQMSLSGNVYTTQQAFDRARARTWNARADLQANMFQFAIQGDYTHAQVPARTVSLWNAFNQMRRKSPAIMSPFLDYTTDANIFMCYSKLPRHLLGQWDPGPGLVVINERGRDNPNDAAMVTQVLGHELLHMAQNNNGLGTVPFSWTIEERQMRTLGVEAAASTVMILIAIEYKMNGDDSMWKFGNPQETQFAGNMLDIYKRARDDGKTHKQALEAAGQEGFGLMFKRQWWLNSYNNSLANNMFDAIVNGNAHRPDGSFTLEQMQRAGEIAPDFNFTRNLASRPTEDMRFGNNSGMRQTFEYLHLQHLSKALGPQHEAVRAQTELMHKTGNPYVGVDFKDFSARAGAIHTDRNLNVLLDAMIGRGPMPAPSRTPAPPDRFMCS